MASPATSPRGSQFLPPSAPPPVLEPGEEALPVKPPPLPERRFTASLSSFIPSSSSSTVVSPNSRAYSPSREPSLLHLDLRIQHQNKLTEINEKLQKLLDDLVRYNQEITSLENSIAHHEKQPNCYNNLSALFDTSLEIGQLIELATASFNLIKEEFNQGDLESSHAWTSNPQWPLYATYQQTTETISKTLGSLKVPDFPPDFLRQKIQEKNRENSFLKSRNEALTSKNQSCCIILSNQKTAFLNL